ncbi:MAG: Type secretory pathway VirD4 component-like [Ilumatobacteraceae bacterium]|nr:Type secretory pathway VirD4 component-like [Ilumatobacteraceae bacterium]
MIGLLVVAGLCPCTALAALLGVRWRNIAADRNDLVSYELHLPRQLEPTAVTTWLIGVSGLLLPQHKRWTRQPFVVLSVVADSQGIRHYLQTPCRWQRSIETALSASVPSVRWEPADSVDLPVAQSAAEYRLSTSDRSLRTDGAPLAAKLLTALQPLSADERLVVQWTLAPAAPVMPARLQTSRQTPTSLLDDAPSRDGEAVAALRAKQRSPLLLSVLRIGASASEAQRARTLLGHTEAPLQEARAPGVGLQRRRIPSRTVAERINGRAVPLLGWPAVLNADELTGLLAWPIGVDQLPGLTLSGYRLIPASPAVPTEGTVIGDSTFPGQTRPLAIGVQARLRAVHVLGPVGSGKSVLLLNMASQDLLAGHGLIVLDAKGDLIQDLLTVIPASRKSDVIVLDPADTERPVGLNPLATFGRGNGDVLVENLVGLFKSLYASSWGPRTDDILRASLLAVMHRDDATLADIPMLLMNADHRRQIVAGLNDPIGLGQFFNWFEALSPAERLNVTGPVQNKLRSVLMRPNVRSIVAQPNPTWSFHDVMAKQQILLVSLASGLIGTDAASLIGALLVSEMWNATLARAGLPQSQRPPVMAYIDEWQRFMHVPTPMDQILAEARGLGLGMTLAHQYLHQLTDEARNAVLSTVRSRVIFQMPAGDAGMMAKELSGMLSADDLQGLGAYEVAAQLFANGSTQPPATGRTRPAPAPISDPAELRALSRQRYGIDRQVIEDALRARIANVPPEAPVGRRPRPNSGPNAAPRRS